MSFGYQILGFGSSAASRELVLNVTSNTTDVNILTLATAAGYNASTDTTPIILNIASGVDVVGSSGDPGIITGALNAASDVTINVASGASVCGFDGANNTSTGGAGGDGTSGARGAAYHVQHAVSNVAHPPPFANVSVTLGGARLAAPAHPTTRPRQTPPGRRRSIV